MLTVHYKFCLIVPPRSKLYMSLSECLIQLTTQTERASHAHADTHTR